MSPVTIVGAGAIGGTIGAYLTRAGVEVRLVDKVAEHVTAMRTTGLRIEGFGESFTTKVDAVLPEELSAPLGTVLLAVKAQDTEAAVRSLLPSLDKGSVVVSLQNGLCERTIARLIGPERTVGCLVNFSADYLQPGVITYGGPGTVRLGELDGRPASRVDRLAELLSPFGTVEVTSNIWGYVWGKLGYANVLFGSALTDETMADVIDSHRALVVDLASEVYEVAALERIEPVAFDDVEPALYVPRDARDWATINASLDRLVARRRADRKTHSGIWRDLAIRKRRTEVDHQIGAVAEIGRGHGLPMPLTARVVSMIHEIEDGARKRDLANLEELELVRRETASSAEGGPS
ncbi:MAG TPA: 2-dehydropantoate 2-reductase [Amycolatopsis sp.]|nr:2-dehydropantoate 2-reductase [Amycolatopsis sp.]